VHANGQEQRWPLAEAAMAWMRDEPDEWDEWREYQAEAERWDATSADGLDDLPYEFDVLRDKDGM
jgi:hypothetical protein